jgi:nitroreductase
MQARAQRELPAREVILEQLNWRYATKRYDPSRKISAEDWQALRSALTLAPSSFGLQPYKFVVVENKDLREKLREAAWDQPQFTDASHLVVFAYKKTLNDSDLKSFADRIGKGWGQTSEQNAQLEATVKGAANKAVDGGYMETWNSRQVYIALGFLLETAALLGIDATPMEGFDAAKFNESLGLDDHSAVVVCALGYRDADSDWLASKSKVRKDGAELFEVK